jgi:hypothetical protein
MSRQAALALGFAIGAVTTLGVDPMSLLVLGAALLCLGIAARNR